VIYNDLVQDWKGRTLLIVEDDEASYQYFESLLKKTGIDIIWIRNGVEFVNYIEKKEHPADIILMDILIPLKNGIDATRVIKKMHPEIPVIIITAYASREVREKSFLAGCDAYLTKPILPHTLIKTVEEYMDKKQEVRAFSRK
jgi:CheY-like chemotaxis protein